MNKIVEEIFAFYSFCRQPPFCCDQQPGLGGHTCPVQEGPHIPVRGLPPGVHPDHRESGEKSFHRLMNHLFICGTSFSLYSHLKMHNLKKHLHLSGEKVLVEILECTELKSQTFFENAFACNFCGMLFPSKSHLRMHDLIYH